ncbi:hypothetical protein DFJ74DRAFT_667692 [Hyaloraphidium curvatum]|nr:hypothetical protein DFJ74DRAFT_667692 [Hyaloraphidium curvatum]
MDGPPRTPSPRRAWLRELFGDADDAALQAGPASGPAAVARAFSRVLARGGAGPALPVLPDDYAHLAAGAPGRAPPDVQPGPGPHRPGPDTPLYPDPKAPVQARAPPRARPGRPPKPGPRIQKKDAEKLKRDALKAEIELLEAVLPPAAPGAPNTKIAIIQRARSTIEGLLEWQREREAEVGRARVGADAAVWSQRGDGGCAHGHGQESWSAEPEIPAGPVGYPSPLQGGSLALPAATLAPPPAFDGRGFGPVLADAQGADWTDLRYWIGEDSYAGADADNAVLRLLQGYNGNSDS